MPTIPEALARITAASRAASAAGFRGQPDAGALFNVALLAHDPAFALGVPQADIDRAAKEGWKLGRADAGAG